MTPRLAAAALLAASVAPATAPPETLGTGELTAASPLARHRLALAAGEYAMLRLEPATCEIALAARHGTATVVEGDTLAFPPGSLTLALASDAARELDLELRPGRGCERVAYSLRVLERRPTRPEDEKRLEAQRAYLAGERLRIQGTAATRAEARVQLTRARDLYAALGDAAGEGNALTSLGRVADGLGERPAAIAAYTDALRLHRAQGRDVAVSWTLNFLALTHDEQGNRELAMAELEEAAAAAQRAGDARVEGVTLNDIGLIQHNLGDRHEALFFYNEALPLHRIAGNLRGEAVTLTGMGVAHDLLGNKKLSMEELQQALALRRTLGEPREVAVVLNNLGTLHFSLDQITEAVGYYRQALASWREAGDATGEAATLHNMAQASDYSGEYQEALDGYQEALRLFTSTGARARAANTQTNLARLYGKLGDRRQAERFTEESLATHRATGNRQFESAALSGLGALYAARGESARAVAAYEEALAIRRALGEPQLVAQSLRDLGVEALAAADYDRAEALSTEALRVYQSIPNRRGQCQTLLHLSGAFLRRGETEEALYAGEEALVLAREANDPRYEAAALYALAQVDVARDALPAARERLESAIAILERIRARLGSEELRASFLAGVQDYYVLLVDVLMRLHGQRPGESFDTLALEAAERARARGLLDILSEALAGVRAGADPELRERERRLLHALSAKAERQARAGTGRDRDDAAGRARARDIDALNDELRALQAEMRARSPRYAGLVAPQPLGAREIQAQLDEGTVLLQFALGRERSWLWRITSSSIEAHELPGGAQLDALARRFQDLVRREGNDPGPAAAELGRALLAPVAESLRAPRVVPRVVIVPDGALHLVPAAALVSPASGRALVTDHEVVVLPSVSVLALLRQQAQGRKPAPRTVAVVADPVFDAQDPRVRARLKGLPPPGAPAGDAAVTREAPREGATYARLPGARREALAVMSQAGTRTALRALDFDASRATVSGDRLSRARIVHFATHGVLDDVRPALSGLVLSLVDERGRRQDGFLRLPDVYNLTLPADLVVLSACQTGLGQELRGEGLVGLTRGFMYAGARSVVATLWKVDDRATAELVSRFYAALLGPRRLTPAAALRDAQVSMAREPRWRSPYFWAGFVLQGEWAR